MPRAPEPAASGCRRGGEPCGREAVQPCPAARLQARGSSRRESHPLLPSWGKPRGPTHRGTDSRGLSDCVFREGRASNSETLALDARRGSGHGNHGRFSKPQAPAGGHGVDLLLRHRRAPLPSGLGHRAGVFAMSCCKRPALSSQPLQAHGLSWVLGGDTAGKPTGGCDLGPGHPAGQGPRHRAPAICRRPAVGQRTTACPGDGRRGLWCLVPSLPHARGAALCSRLLAAGPAVPVRSGASGLLTGLTSCVPRRCVAMAGSCRAEFRWSRALSPPPPHTGCAWTGRKA